MSESIEKALAAVLQAEIDKRIALVQDAADLVITQFRKLSADIAEGKVFGVPHIVGPVASVDALPLMRAVAQDRAGAPPAPVAAAPSPGVKPEDDDPYRVDNPHSAGKLGVTQHTVTDESASNSNMSVDHKRVKPQA